MPVKECTGLPVSGARDAGTGTVADMTNTTERHPTTTSTTYRTPAWLMVGSTLAFVAWLAAAMTTISGTGVTDTADLTPRTMATIRVGFLVTTVLYAVAYALGGAGLATVAARLRRGGARVPATAALVAAAGSVAAIAGYPVAALLAGGFDAGRLGDQGAWDAAIGLSIAAMWLALGAIALGGVALRTSGALRRTGLVVAVIAGIALVADVVLGAVLPPFLVGLLLLPYAIGLLRRPVASPA
jgi:hypothetical protein